MIWRSIQLDNPTFFETHPNHLSFERCLYCEYLQWGVLVTLWLHRDKPIPSCRNFALSSSSGEKKRIFLYLLVIYFLRLHHPMSSHSERIAIATIVTNNQSNQRSHKDISCITHYLLCPIHPSLLFLAARDANSPVMFPQRNLENSGKKNTSQPLRDLLWQTWSHVPQVLWVKCTWIWYPAL